MYRLVPQFLQIQGILEESEEEGRSARVGNEAPQSLEQFPEQD